MKNRLLALPLVLAGLLPAAAQDFYDPATIQEIRLTFAQGNWDYLLDSLKDADDADFLLATSVEINGQLFPNVGVAYKGNNSYDDDFAKNPLQIELDYAVSGQQYQGWEEIRLGNGYSDPSFIREVLSAEILRQYQDAPGANFARLWINGQYWGLYTNLEPVDKRFVRRHFFTDGDNPFFKCNPADFDGPGTGGNYSDLVYAGPDSSDYDDKYKLESDHGWRELLALMDTLQNNPAGSPTLLDVDRALWMLAFNNVFVNLDSYTGAYAQNYYLYWDENGRWLPVVWDLDLSLGAFPLLTPPGGAGGPPLTLTQMQQLDPLVQADNPSRPLIRQLLANPTWRRMYLAHLRTLVQENLSNGAYADRAVELQSNIAAAVQADTKKFFNYAAFQNSLATTVDGGFAGEVPGIRELLDARRDYLNAHPSLTPTPPSIGAASAQALNGNTVQVLTLLENADAAWIGWRFDSAAVFQKTPLYDDGQHGDDAAGDGLWGGDFALLGSQAQYFIYAENAAAGQFLPARAEHEFFILNVSLATAAAGQVVLNEFLANNQSGATDEAGEREDWLELYNGSDQTLSLAGLYLSDKPTDPTKWTFPAGTFIVAGGYRIVWLDEDVEQGDYHAAFKLGAGGENLLLSGPDATLFDQVTFGTQQADVSLGRYPNGTGPFLTIPTTFNGPNTLSSAVEDPAAAQFRLYPNPVANFLTLESSGLLGPVQVFDLLGHLVLSVDEITAKNSGLLVLDFGPLPPGIYGLRAGTQFSRLVVVQR